ncbi:MAG: hypothetical protein PHC28_07850 [Flavobacterium sp.]|uniref:hypothetical protein n=1 Tax=Flavobacterium sp. TaxID=239 RepID=UPI0026359C9E|nr:hypothetical protein [Flavobacterium sp.]MDD5150385.1 hypothetical protein [Flavobacterium sp.]
MAITNRTDFINYCRRALGEPVIELNIADEQIEDRVDDALNKFWDFHADGSIKNFIVYQLTPLDITNRYIPIEDNTLSVLKIYPQNSYSNIYNPQQMSIIQTVANSIVTSGGMVSYLIQQQYIETINQFFNREKMIRFNRYSEKLLIDTDWSEFKAGTYILIEIQEKVLPQDNPNVWNNGWLKKYATSLIGIQWGLNLSKYDGFQLPSGMVLNGSVILQQYQDMKSSLEEELISTWQLPIDFLIG